MDQQKGTFSTQEALRFIQSPAGQELMRLLQNSSDPRVEKVKQQAAGGDIEQAAQMLRQMADSGQIKQLLSQLGG